MNYINKTALAEFISSKGSLDPQQLLEQIDHSKVDLAMLESENFAARPFFSTDEPVEEENWAKMKTKDKELLSRIYLSMRKSKGEARRALKRLFKLQKRYPKVPAISNYITAAYATMGENEKCYRTIIDTYQRFPGYLFGRITAAEYCLNHQRHEEVPDILNHKFELYMHYPDAEENPTFHETEIKSFYIIVGRYYAKIGQVALSIGCYRLVNNMDCGKMGVMQLAMEIVAAEVVELGKEAVERSC